MGDWNSYKTYKYEYVDNNGISFLGSLLHFSDQEIISYFQSLEENGGIKIQSLTNSTGRVIYRSCGVKAPTIL